MKLKAFNGRWIARYPGKQICAAIAPWHPIHKKRVLRNTNEDGFRYLFTLRDAR